MDSVLSDPRVVEVQKDWQKCFHHLTSVIKAPHREAIHAIREREHAESGFIEIQRRLLLMVVEVARETTAEEAGTEL